ncbi:MAG: hypothetical protein RLZZ127_1247 [Planctomycetota bacterium]|jgi:thiol:disulfide interchange protein DsbD
MRGLLFLASTVAMAGEPLRAELVLPATIPGGGTATAAVVLTAADGWHWYWSNPGESGMPPRITWDLPAGWTTGEPSWPAPRVLSEHGITTYIIERGALLVPITAPATAAGTAAIGATVSWLACQEVCVPGRSRVEGTVTIGSATAAPVLATDLARHPVTPWPGVAPRALHRPDGTVALSTASGVPDRFVPADEGWFADGAAQPMALHDGRRVLVLTPASPDRPLPDRLRGVLLTGADPLTIDIPLETTP